MLIEQDARTPRFAAEGVKAHFIHGEWVSGVPGEVLETHNPATGEVLARIARGGQEDVDLAVASSRRAFDGPWSRSSPAQRQALLLDVASAVENHWDELASLESADIGIPLSRAQHLKPVVLQMINFFATQTVNCTGLTIPNSLPEDFSTMTLKAPVGVVGGIIPWNGPLISQFWIIGGALATGCTCVLKPAEDGSLSILRTAEILVEAGVPEGVVNVVTGLGNEAGAALAGHPDVDRVQFTGSTNTGREIIHSSAVNIKRIQLELGGKSPNIVFADANLDNAVPGAAMAVYNNSGQICYAGTRLFVQREIHDEFVERLVDFTKTVVVGDPLDPASQLGPLISQRQMDRVLGYVDSGSSEGAKVAVGGSRIEALGNGYFVEPTVFSEVDNQMKIAREEIFGPVISVIPFDGVEDALRLANDTSYGLGSGVWTENIRTMHTMVNGIKAGTVWGNCYGLHDLAVGFGGAKESGYGWKGGYDHVEGFLYQKAVTIKV